MEDRPKTISSCPFCGPPPSRILFHNGHAVAVRDEFPVSPGHTLILPRRHVASFFDTTPEEREALIDLLFRMRIDLERGFSPDGFNIGINDGAAAGQTIGHLHIHLIPRYEGDAPDPRGGVRRIFPEKAPYWEEDGS